MRSRSLGYALSISLLLSSAHASAQAIGIPFEGILQDGGGQPIDGVYDVDVRLYTDPIGGAPLYVEHHRAVRATHGEFRLLIGAVSPPPASLFVLGDALWVGFAVGVDELTPRFELTAAPFAIRALSTSSVAGATGAQGAIGANGPAGAVGMSGAQGATGPAGSTGAQGTAGVTGATGPLGSTGHLGTTGAAGHAGSAGSAGHAGAVGPAGTNAGVGLSLLGGTLSVLFGGSGSANTVSRSDHVLPVTVQSCAMPNAQGSCACPAGTVAVGGGPVCGGGGSIIGSSPAQSGWGCICSVASSASVCNVTCMADASSGSNVSCPPSPACDAPQTFNCCYRGEAGSPYDLDGDGYIGCQSPCGAWLAACTVNTTYTTPCDCDDSNPLVYPGNGC
jgi:hypothetical protein